jgi:hypothetical protein
MLTTRRTVEPGVSVRRLAHAHQHRADADAVGHHAGRL